MKPLVVLSCFDGISAGQFALERAGIPVKVYYAFEIDKYAIKVTQGHYPKTVQLGDITEWKKLRKGLPIPDLIIGGSPCQGFSNAGKGLNFDDPRSKLFFTFVDIIKYYQKKNPSLKFMLENVRMRKEWQEIITKKIGVEPVLINSSLVSAQNRKRLYWTNFGKIEQPEDKHIYLKDILEDGEVDRDKSFAMDANYFKGGNEKSYFTKRRRQLVKLPDVQGAALRNQVTSRGIESQLNIRTDNKSNCVVPTYPAKLNGVVIRRNGHGYIPTEIKSVEKSDTLREATSGNFAIRVGTAKDIKGHDYNKRVYSLEGKFPSLTANTGGNHHSKVAEDGCIYRKLTPIECERLQTFDDGFTLGISNTQRYKCLGNSWTVDVIVHIFGYLK